MILNVSLSYRNVIQLYSTQFHTICESFNLKDPWSRIGKSFLITISPAPLCNRKSSLETFFSSEMKMELVSLKWPHAISWDFTGMVGVCQCLSQICHYTSLNSRPLVFQALTCAPAPSKRVKQSHTSGLQKNGCGSSSKDLRTTMFGEISEYAFFLK